MAKSVIPRRLAELDIEAAIGFYLAELSPKAAVGFIDTLERAYAHIAQHPESGSLRYAIELDLPGLRFWAPKHYPYLIFYLEEDDYIDVWRVLHAHKDIPNRLTID